MEKDISLGTYARAALFAYADPTEALQIYKNFKKYGYLEGRQKIFERFVSKIASAPKFSQHLDTESIYYLVPMKNDELWILWPGTRASPEDGFSFNDFKTNLNFRMMPSAIFPGKEIELHNGFERRYLVSRRTLHKKIEQFFPDEKKIVSIGHSLGGALAGICATDLAMSFNLNCSTITLAAPKIGNQMFTDLFTSKTEKSTRIIINDDPVTALPCFPWFKHGQTNIVEINGPFWSMANHPIEVYVNACDIFDGFEISITADQKVRLMVEIFFKLMALYLFLFVARLLIPTFNQFLIYFILVLLESIDYRFINLRQVLF